MAHPDFQDKHHPVQEEQLAAVLGAAKPAWDGLVAALEQAYAPMQQEWKFYGHAAGWILALKHKKRTLAYLQPGDQAGMVTLVYGERAVAAALQHDLPAAVRLRIEQARPYVEGRSFQVELYSAAEIELVLRLVKIKLAPE